MKYMVKFSVEFVVPYDTENKIYYPPEEVDREAKDSTVIQQMARYDRDHCFPETLIEMARYDRYSVSVAAVWAEPQPETSNND